MKLKDLRNVFYKSKMKEIIVIATLHNVKTGEESTHIHNYKSPWLDLCEHLEDDVVMLEPTKAGTVKIWTFAEI